jgi:hypothetical protein
MYVHTYIRIAIVNAITLVPSHPPEVDGASAASTSAAEYSSTVSTIGGYGDIVTQHDKAVNRTERRLDHGLCYYI